MDYLQHYVYIMANITNFYDNLLKEAQSVEDLSRAQDIMYAMLTEAEAKYDALYEPGLWAMITREYNSAEAEIKKENHDKALKNFLFQFNKAGQEKKREEILEAQATKRKEARREANKRRKAALKRNRG